MEILLKFYSIVLLLLLPVIQVTGQKNNYVVHTDHYTSAKGAGGNHAYDCMQDSRGVMWVVWEGSIDRFDGKEFKSFKFPQIKPNPETKFLMEDEENDLWIWVSDQTVFFLNIYTEKLRSSAEKFGKGFPEKVDWAVQGIEGSYLLQDQASNIYRYRRGQDPVLYYSAPGQLVSPLVEYEDGTAWLERNNHGKGGAMIATDRNGKEIINLPYSNSHIFAKGLWGKDTIHYITEDSFFLATFKGIVLRKSLKSMYPGYQFSAPYNTGRFQKISVEQDRNLVWVYLPYNVLVFDKSLRLLFEFKTPKFTFLTTDVYDIFTDNQNHTWLSTFGGLYNINFKPNPFHWYLVQDTEQPELGDLKSMRKICKAADGNIYALAAPDLYCLKPDGSAVPVLRTPDGKEQAVVLIEAEENGNLWFTNGPMYCYNVFSRKLTKLPIRKKTNWYLKKIGDEIWSGYPLSVVTFKNNLVSSETIFSPFDEDDYIEIYNFIEKGGNEYWVPTERGLFLFSREKGVLAHYSTSGTGKYYLPASNIRHLHIDKAGDFWMATTEGLLYWRYSTGEYHLYGAAEGLKANCSAVLEDDYGCLWVSSDYGLIKFDKATKKVRTFLVTDGLPSDEFNRLSYFEDEATGDMYLGGLNGLVKFHPRDLQDQVTTVETKANLVLTECLIFSEKTNKEEDIRAMVLKDNLISINPGDLFLKIKFALTDYTKPTDITYSYLIEGYNNNWHTGRENELLLSGLPYGHYTLRVKAVSPNGVPYEKEMRIPIRVWPPFYLRTWFLALMTLLTGVGIMWYIRRRTRLLREKTIELEALVRERTGVIDNQRKTLKQLYDSKSRLYANITHEFRTPLTLIIGPAEQALKKAGEIGSEELQNNLTYILQNSGQLLGLVNQMLDLNKLESGAMRTDYYQSDIAAFLSRVVGKFSHYATYKEIEMTFQAEPAEMLMDFDAEITEKIINNLLSNAVKFTPSGGRITITAISSTDRLAIEVADNGVGISAAQLPFIFQRYYQADNSASRRSEGTGIGLALVKELVELLEGSISVESTPGHGTSFTLTLPVRRVAPLKDAQTHTGGVPVIYPAPVVIAPAHPENDESTGEKPLVIVIEDNPAMAAFVTSCISDQYRVMQFTDSRKGLAAVQEQLPDLVISDLMMPEMDGYELCTTLKTDERTSHIPVVFLSAVSEQSERLKRLNAGADAYVSKPFNAVELQTVAASLLHSRAMLRQRYLALSSETYENENARDTGQPVETLNQVDVEFIEKVKNTILGHLPETEFDGNQLARMLGFSTSQLHRKLTALTGLPAGRYIYQIRLEAARELLRQKDLTISEIAYQTGFSDPAYFTKMFSRAFGRSPRHYRSSLSDAPDINGMGK